MYVFWHFTHEIAVEENSEKTMSFKGKGELNQGKGERDSFLVSKKCLYLDRGLI